MSVERVKENSDLMVFAETLRLAEAHERKEQLRLWVETLYEAAGRKHESEYKFVINPRIYKNNKRIANFDKYFSEKDLGYLLIGDQEYDISRQVYPYPPLLAQGNEKPVKHLDYYLYDSQKSKAAEFQWEWLGNEYPKNVHRVVREDLREQGLGRLFLRLSEDVFKKMKIPKASAESGKPASIAWFIRQGYSFSNFTDYNNQVLASIRDNFLDFSKVLPAYYQVQLEKDLTVSEEV